MLVTLSAINQSINVALFILVTKTQTCTVTCKIKQDIAIVFTSITSLSKTKKMHLWLGGAAVERSALDQQAAGGPQVQFPAGRLQKVVLPLISE